MIAALLAFFFFLLNAAAVEAAAQSECPTYDIIVNKRNQLEELLCPYRYEECDNDITLSLSTDVIHEVSSGNYCTINITHSLTITSNPTDTVAKVNCIPKNKTHYDKYWTRGFAFYGTNASLTVRGLNITNCGTNLTTLNSEIINSTSSPIHFTKYQAAVLVFTGIASLMVDNVTITNYNGFAIVAVNLPNASFNCLNITSNNNEMPAFKMIGMGSGMLLLFFDQTNNASRIKTTEYNLQISNSIFQNNYAFNQYYFQPHLSCSSEVYHRYNSSMPVINAACMTVLHFQTDIPAGINFLNSTFQHCYGFLGAALLIMRLNSSLDSRTIIDGSHFSSNAMIIEDCHGTAIAGNFYFDSIANHTFRPLEVTNTKFTSNGQESIQGWATGAIDIAVLKMKDNYSDSFHANIHFVFRNVTFDHNTAHYTGAAIYGASYVYPYITKMNNSVTFVLESIVAYDNPTMNNKNDRLYVTVSIFHFKNIRAVIINGSVAYPGNFSQNYGSVFELIGVNVVLSGTLIFSDNIADQGGVFLLREDSQLLLKEGLQATFTKNVAQSLGGAIYADGHNYLRGPCTFQLYCKDNFSNISLKFTNNTAGLGGNAVYSTRLYNCSGTSEKIYNKIFDKSWQHKMSSYVTEIEICDVKKMECYISSGLYPGKLLQIPVKLHDRIGSSTYGVVTVRAVEQHGLKPVNWWFDANQKTTIVTGKENCTIINLTIHSSLNFIGKESILLFSVLDSFIVTGVKVMLDNCPLGFQLSEKTGTCICSDVFYKFLQKNEQSISCDIQSKSFQKPKDLIDLWIGKSIVYHNFSVGFCNPRYCNLGLNLSINASGTYINSTIPLCHGSRTGDLCGECIKNYSVVFGSAKCELCTSKWWPFTVIVYIIAGPLIVLLLYTLNLTLTTGTLNGVIFYAQLANVGILLYYIVPCIKCSEKYDYFRLPIIFISWMNLNLGFPLCFFHNMTELWKAGLSLLFPIYLLLIIVFFSILSRFSSKISNRFSRSFIQVLVTVVYLSFTQLLQTLLDVFSSTQIYTENKAWRTVWFNNGAIAYGSSWHMRLMIITSVVVGVILIPYMVVILFGKRLLKIDRFREYIRPFYEAIHAPYKTNRSYWFGLHQLFVVLVYVAETISGGHHVVILIFFILLLIYHILIAFQSSAMPFKSKILNMMNIVLLLNLNMTFLISEYLVFNGSMQTVVIFFAVANYPVIVISFFIIVYHILVATNKLDNVILFCHRIGQHFTLCIQKRSSPEESNQCGVFLDTGDYSQAREPLLECTLD